MFYCLLLYIIHKVLDCVFYLHHIFKNLCCYINRINVSWKKLQPVHDLFNTRLEKLPTHLAIIINEESLSLKDLSNIIKWCLCLDIHNVSIYDFKGNLKKNSVHFYKLINTRLENDKDLQKLEISFEILFENLQLSSFSQAINGHKKVPLHLYLLSPEDGKQTIVKASKNVCTLAKECSSLLENFNVHHFEEYLRDELNICDPDLLLVFGKTHGLTGYLPWHIRLSEIFFHPTHHNFYFEELYHVLFKFSNCEQRCGK